MKEAKISSKSRCMNYKNTHDLLDDLAGGVKVNETLVDLELVAIPGLGTLTARL